MLTPRQIIISFLFLFLSRNSVQAQSDLEYYINIKTSRIEKLVKKGEFEDGIIYLPNKTADAELLRFSGKKRQYHYLFVVARIDDKVKVYKADDILGYEVDNTLFNSHRPDGSAYFIKRTIEGRCTLYERPSIPYDNKYLIYLKFPDVSNYLVISPNEENFIDHMENANNRNGAGGKLFIYSSKNLGLKFEQFIYTYFDNCNGIHEAVRTGILNINNIREIVLLYNECEGN